MKLESIFGGYIERVLEKYGLHCSNSVLILLKMIAAFESMGFECVGQLDGPALGLFQMEPRTFYDVIRYIKLRPDKFNFDFCGKDISELNLIFCIERQIVLARIFFMRIPEPLPDFKDLDALASYAKKYWNTEKGKTTKEDYKNAYMRLIAGEYD